MPFTGSRCSYQPLIMSNSVTISLNESNLVTREGILVMGISTRVSMAFGGKMGCFIVINYQWYFLDKEYAPKHTLLLTPVHTL